MEKIAVGILGATGMVGQKFVEMLAKHPWFEITALAASDRSVGKPYAQAINWNLSYELPPALANMCVSPCLPNLPCSVVFSGLDSSVAGQIESDFAHAGYKVISNCRNHRMDEDVPLLIPEVNSDHLQLVAQQPFGQGAIITNPNCSVIGITMALKPLLDNWGIDSVNIVTMQAISGAGYPGVASLDIVDNIIPYIEGEEAKVESEPLKIMGHYQSKKIIPHQMKLSAQCMRVGVTHGHMACISVKLKQTAQRQDILHAWQDFHREPQLLQLPSAPLHPIVYLPHDTHPQPKLHRQLGNGMAVAVGRLRPCHLFDWKFVILSHNTIRGAAGCAILNGELMAKKGFLKVNI